MTLSLAGMGVGDRRRIRPLPAILAIALLIGLGGCGGGGGSPVAPTPPPDPTPEPGVRFEPAGGGLQPEIVSLGLSEDSADSVVLVMSASRVTDLYGYGVDLSFDPSILEFDGFEPGPFLQRGDADVASQVAENPEGNLVIGQSRLGDVEGASGSGQLLFLRFTILDSGSTRMRFSDGSGFDSDGDDVDLGFFGGTLTITGAS